MKIKLCLIMLCSLNLVALHLAQDAWSQPVAIANKKASLDGQNEQTDNSKKKVKGAKNKPKVKKGDVKFKGERKSPDRKGTVVRNIYEFNLDFFQPGEKHPGPYLVVYHLDEKPITQFDDVTLPFSFKRNFKGISEGEHTVKIEIQDLDGTTLAFEETKIMVVK